MVSFLIAGCLSKEPPATTTVNGPSLSETFSGTPVQSPVQTKNNVTPPEEPKVVELRFEECYGALGFIDVPADRVRPELPQGLDAAGSVPGTAVLQIMYLECKRIKEESKVESNVSFFFSYVWVDVANESRRNPGLSEYMLDWIQTSALATKIFGKFGISPGNGTIRRHDTPVPPVTKQDWDAISGNRSFSFSVTRQGTPLNGGGGPGSRWFTANGNLVQTIFLEQYDFDAAQAGPAILDMDGDSATRRILGDSIPLEQIPFATFGMTMTFRQDSIYKEEQ